MQQSGEVKVNEEELEFVRKVMVCARTSALRMLGVSSVGSWFCRFVYYIYIYMQSALAFWQWECVLFQLLGLKLKLPLLERGRPN